jgi:hypothetical protein
MENFQAAGRQLESTDLAQNTNQWRLNKSMDKTLRPTRWTTLFEKREELRSIL